MKKEQLQEELKLKTRQWQKWCSSLGFPQVLSPIPMSKSLNSDSSGNS